MEATWVFAPQIKEISHYRRRRSPFPHANQINHSRVLEFRLRASAFSVRSRAQKRMGFQN